MAALPREQVRPAIRAGISARAAVATPPRFKVGGRVIARNMHPTGHTRLPRYVRGKRGTVQRHHGGFVFPGTRAHGLGDQPQHLYSVRFEARELWGEGAAEHDGIYLDLWESYLQFEGAT
ncbi:MAG: SH3-like domain-containing protein [Steroidobacteraceae bacterium]